MRLYHLPGSRSTRVLWTLEEIGAPYELTILADGEKSSPEHLRRHPLGRVPVLELDDGQHMFESAAICLHLGDLYPEAGIVPPPATTERALVYQWTVFAMAEVEPAVFSLLRARRAEEDETALTERLLPVVTVLRDVLSDGRPWIAGETFTVSDVLCSSIFGTALRRELITETGVIPAYVERARARPANQRAEAVKRD